jgi:hypothetical protein
MFYDLLGTMNSVECLDEYKQFALYTMTTEPKQTLYPSLSSVKRFHENLFSNEFLEDPLFKIDHTKMFVTLPGQGYHIHKDGANKFVALNVIVDCNVNDWVRWYNKDTISEYKNIETEWNDTVKNYSLNIDIENWEDVPFAVEARHRPGDIYLVNVDEYHSYKNNGDTIRIVLQSKFAQNPTMDDVRNKILNNRLLNVN